MICYILQLYGPPARQISCSIHPALLYSPLTVPPSQSSKYIRLGQHCAMQVDDANASQHCLAWPRLPGSAQSAMQGSSHQHFNRPSLPCHGGLRQSYTWSGLPCDGAWFMKPLPGPACHATEHLQLPGPVQLGPGWFHPPLSSSSSTSRNKHIENYVSHVLQPL